jgi:hypothetical protein
MSGQPGGNLGEAESDSPRRRRGSGCSRRPLPPDQMTTNTGRAPARLRQRRQPAPDRDLGSSSRRVRVMSRLCGSASVGGQLPVGVDGAG